MQVARLPYQSHFDRSTCIQPQNYQFRQYMSGWHSGIVRRRVESKFTLLTFFSPRSEVDPSPLTGRVSPLTGRVSMDIWARTVRMIRSFLVYTRVRINLRDVALQLCLVAACRARAQAYWCPQGGAGKRSHDITWTEMFCVSRHVQRSGVQGTRRKIPQFLLTLRTLSVGSQKYCLSAPGSVGK